MNIREAQAALRAAFPVGAICVSLESWDHRRRKIEDEFSIWISDRAPHAKISESGPDLGLLVAAVIARHTGVPAQDASAAAECVTNPARIRPESELTGEGIDNGALTP